DIGEELLVIECGVGVQPGSGSFTGGGVRRVDEHCRSWVRANCLEGVAVLETDPIAEGSDGVETLDESFGVPAGRQPPPSLASLHETSSRGHDAAPLTTVLDDGAEGPVDDGVRGSVEDLTNVVESDLEAENLVAQVLHAAVGPMDQDLPNRRYIVVEFHEHHMLSHPFCGCGESDDVTARKGLQEHLGSTDHLEPFTGDGDQPCLASGIAERTDLTNLGDVYWQPGACAKGEDLGIAHAASSMCSWACRTCGSRSRIAISAWRGTTP